MTVGPAGLIFTIVTNAAGVVTAATPQFFPDTEATGGNPPVSAEANAEVPYTGDNQLVVTGAAFTANPATVAALCVSSPVTIPAGALRSKVAYSSLGGPCTATAW